MERQTLVRHVRANITGVVVDDAFSVCDDDQVPVVWEGRSWYRGTRSRYLEVIGPENAIAEPDKCGVGKGAEACIFLTYGMDGWGCQRFGKLRTQLIFAKSKMGAQREPVEMFPNCYLSEA